MKYIYNIKTSSVEKVEEEINTDIYDKINDTLDFFKITGAFEFLSGTLSILEKDLRNENSRAFNAGLLKGTKEFAARLIVGLQKDEL